MAIYPTEPVPTLADLKALLIDHMKNMATEQVDVDYGEHLLERICASERQRAYEDCGSKGGKTVRAYAKSRAEQLQTLIEETPSE